MQPRNDRDGTDLAQKAVLALGGVYTLIGVVGFFITGFDDFAGKTGETLLGFEINGLHNLVHLLIGVAGLAMWRRVDTARTFGWMLFAAYGVTFFYGLAVAGKDADQGNFLSINAADNVLHLVSALAGLAIGLTAGRRTGTTSANRQRTTTGR